MRGVRGGQEMKQITTSLGSFLTGDEIADAVLEYSHVLSRDQQTDLVDIPVVANGGAVRLRFTVGWLVQLQTIGAESDRPDLVDRETAKSLRARIEQRRTGGATPGRASEPWPGDQGWLDDYDL